MIIHFINKIASQRDKTISAASVAEVSLDPVLKVFARRLLALCLILFFPAYCLAQEDPEYKMEIGAGVGLMGYIGDFNANFTKDQQPMGTIMARYNFDTYMGLKFNASYGKIKGSSSDVKDYFPAFSNEKYTFDNTLIGAGVTFECNFWPYGTGQDYRGAKRLVPYLFGGMEMTYVDIKNGDKKNDISANIPLGLGIKYKIGKRMNLGVEWALHFSLCDYYDGKKDPFDIKSSGAFKNTDCYSALQVTFTYSFMARCKVCHNEDED